MKTMASRPAVLSLDDGLELASLLADVLGFGLDVVEALADCVGAAVALLDFSGLELVSSSASGPQAAMRATRSVAPTAAVMRDMRNRMENLSVVGVEEPDGCNQD
jgi:hypothetical protein